MSKMKLANNETLTIEDGAALGAFTVITDDILSVWSLLTDDNLASVSLSNDDSEEAFATYTDLTCGNTVSVRKADNGRLAATFPIREKTELEILKAKLAKIESEQADQNDAIDSLTDAALA